MATANTSREGGTYVYEVGFPSSLNSPVCASFLSLPQLHSHKESPGRRPQVPKGGVSQAHWGLWRDRWLDTEKQPGGEAERYRDKKKTGTDGVNVAVWSLGSSVQVSWAVGAQIQLTSPTWGNGERTQQSLTS